MGQYRRLATARSRRALSTLEPVKKLWVRQTLGEPTDLPGGGEASTGAPG
jgi:hypothetical protein